MIVNDEAELMYPVPISFVDISGLGGLGCGDDKSCGCGCSTSTTGLKGLGDITDRSDFGMSLCNWTPLRWTPMCDVPSVEDIIKDTSNDGGSLDPGYKQQGEDMARAAIAGDCKSNPQLYTDVPGSCSYSNPTLGIFLMGLAAVLIIRNT